MNEQMDGQQVVVAGAEIALARALADAGLNPQDYLG